MLEKTAAAEREMDFDERILARFYAFLETINIIFYSLLKCC